MSQQGIQRLNEDGTIDSSFILSNLIGGTIVQPDGKILVIVTYFLRRLNENGSNDTGFTTTTFPFPAVTMALANDGRITLATRTGNDNDYQIRRFLADGTADSSFTPYIAHRFSSLAVQSDGGVLIGDRDSTYPVNMFRNDFVRLFPNGSPDLTFNIGGDGFQTGFPGFVGAINVQPDGKILIGGRFELVNDVPRSNIARLNANSTLDPTFQISTGGTANYFSEIWSFSNIRTQSDGKIVVSGSFSYFVNGVRKSNLVRLNSDGSIDPTFILGVPIEESGTKPLVTFNDGKLLVGNSRFSLAQTAVPVKLTATGERDTSFNANLYPQDNPVYSRCGCSAGRKNYHRWRPTFIRHKKKFSDAAQCRRQFGHDISNP